MVKTVREFRDELRAVREEMYEYGESADVELVASWLDRVVISLEKMTDTMELMGVELEMLSKRPASTNARKPKKAAKKKAKKPVKKKPKKAAKKKIGKAIFKAKKAKKKKPAKKKRRR
jgi:leucyl aminopeptidase (aminopeptidase T)